jgi:Protein of unknown function (DUF2845)
MPGIYMRRILKFICLSLLMLISFLTTANAESFRCGSQLVHIGDIKNSVALKCGAPLLKDSFCEPVKNKSGLLASNSSQDKKHQKCIQVDIWTYKPEKGRFITTLRFELGKLNSIVYGDRAR